ncbi:MAG: hypothetical protein KGH50_03625, partial [Candidatus Micrarchaeota archaeon]|nr:hypothetical protein [Candidatus Micrarchaeota archaeon]
MEPVLYKRGVRAGHIHGSRSVSENIITLVPTARQFVKQAYEYGAKGKFRKEAKQWRLAETEAKAHNRHLMA